MIQVKSLSKTYRKNTKNPVPALKNINFEIPEGDIVGIVGTSGSGKSTLLNILGGLDREYDGEVLIEQKDIKKYDQNVYRRKMVGTVFQQFNLLGTLSVLENVLVPITFGKQMTKSESIERAKTLLTRVGLADRMSHKPNELSGGQMQRVAIARGLIARPRILLADEPTGNLDTKTGEEIMSLLKELNTEEKMTLLIVTHDSELVSSLQHKIYLRDGEVLEEMK